MILSQSLKETGMREIYKILKCIISVPNQVWALWFYGLDAA